MKRTVLALFVLLLASRAYAEPGQHLVPAGSLINCTVSDPKLSSRTAAIDDPVLCHLSHSERYGRSTLPYNSYLVGRFEEYKDPGHFVGKGWMVLRFARMVIEPDTILPIDARVVDVAGYQVDTQGRILGKGHAVRDTVMWSLPILWPVDMLMLPMRGPRPTLKEETHMTLKVMDDLSVPDSNTPQQDPYGLTHRQTSENVAPQTAAPQQQAYAQPSYAQPTYAQPAYAQPVYVQPMYVQPMYVQPVYTYIPPPPVYIYSYPQVVAPPPAAYYPPASYGAPAAYGPPTAYAPTSYGYGRPSVGAPAPYARAVYRGGYAPAPRVAYYR
jgi:hypothetical protein